ncbi:hypothetical protein V6N11_033570 [Hibiscus sabdariffa]|uniref:RRM domain-containing protein n=1 Tax=Hibiscus sabdariffa TaxID=183260 RepID=A0ABR2PYH3_9ROSI
MERKCNSFRSQNFNRRSHRSFNGSQRYHTQRERFPKQEKIVKGVIRAGVSIFINYRMKSTFAFVHYSNLWEAMNVVDLANNIRMDGFTTRVFLDRKTSEMSKVNIINKKVQNVITLNRAILTRGKDSRTYKEALLNKTRPSSEDGINGNKKSTPY